MTFVGRGDTICYNEKSLTISFSSSDYHILSIIDAAAMS